MTSAVPGAGQGVRISALFRGARNGYFILLFDGEGGDLLAMVAAAWAYRWAWAKGVGREFSLE